MQTIDQNGASFSPKMFISIFEIAKKIAPPRFLTLRLHTVRYQEIFGFADVPKSIQVGPTPGPIPGRTTMRVNCILPPLGVLDGIALKIDDTVSPTQLIFEVHGIAELIVRGIGVQTT